MEQGHEAAPLPRDRKDKFRGSQRALFLLQLCPSFLPFLSLAGSPMAVGRGWAPARCGFEARLCPRPGGAQGTNPALPRCREQQRLAGRDSQGSRWAASGKP